MADAKHLKERYTTSAQYVTYLKSSVNVIRVGIFLDFVRLTARTPHGAHVREPDEIELATAHVLTYRTPPGTLPPPCARPWAWRPTVRKAEALVDDDTATAVAT